MSTTDILRVRPKQINKGNVEGNKKMAKIYYESQARSYVCKNINSISTPSSSSETYSTVIDLNLQCKEVKNVMLYGHG